MKTISSVESCHTEAEDRYYSKIESLLINRLNLYSAALSDRSGMVAYLDYILQLRVADSDYIHNLPEALHMLARAYLRPSSVFGRINDVEIQPLVEQTLVSYSDNLIDNIPVTAPQQVSELELGLFKLRNNYRRSAPIAPPGDADTVDSDINYYKSSELFSKL